MPHTDDESSGNTSRPELRESLQNAGRRCFLGGLASFLFAAGQACRKAAPPTAAVTLVLIDQTWLDYTFRDRRNLELERFTRETGIQVKLLPAPEGAVETLEVWRNLLESGAQIPDVYAVDVIWPGVLAENLLDLRPFVPQSEIASHFPELIANNTVDGKLAALPCVIDVGLLFYRTDLLAKYGYRAPPRTWDELEQMAERIQAGERARSRKDFWGFVWEGALSESVTCNALEWQASEGGGMIVENNLVTVNNPQAARALARAARWVGSISPPGVVAYKEWDAYNIWQAGQAAFMRNWATSHFGELFQGAIPRDQFDIAALPRGRARNASTVGGRAYAVSRHSLYPRESTMLVRFLCRPDIQLARIRKIGGSPTIPELYNDPGMLAANPYFSTILKTYQNDKVWRPSAQTGKLYPALSRAYYRAVHEILEDKKPASGVLSGLEVELMQITGMKAAAPGAGRGFQGKSAGLRAVPRCNSGPDGIPDKPDVIPGGI
ncbi:MAG TPA: extracellular solute-binding protein [Candidatus Binatia bacterium]|nr:extracellular solute-binding protein [Candidatus Binatia bacterium]